MKPVVVKTGDKSGTMQASFGGVEVIIDRAEESGPRSVEFLMAGLGACTYSTVSHYMKRKGLPLEGLSIELSADKAESENLYDRIQLKLTVSDEIPAKEKSIILNTAKTCRIHKTLKNNPDISIDINL
ncbi:MAG: OsmC family protein [Rhodospirillales bacterium]|nr:OsmC family protein [Rhodospirillales bacterium]